MTQDLQNNARSAGLMTQTATCLASSNSESSQLFYRFKCFAYTTTKHFNSHFKFIRQENAVVSTTFITDLMPWP